MSSCVAVAWMFEDAGRAVLGSLTQAHLNPLRWSLPLSLKQAVAQLRRERSLMLKAPLNGHEHHERPVRITLSRKGLTREGHEHHAALLGSHQIKFETVLDAIDYLQQLVLDEDGPSVEAVQTASMKIEESVSLLCEFKKPNVEAAAAQPATDSDPLASDNLLASAGIAADDASETVVEEVGVSQSIIETPQKAGVSQAIIETFEEENPSMNIKAIEAAVEAAPAKAIEEQKEEQPAADTVAAEAAAAMEVAGQAAIAELHAAETEVAEQAPMQKSRTEGSKACRFAEVAESQANRPVQETSLAAAMGPTESDGAPMQKSRTEGSNKDRRYDFGFSLKLKRCSVCRKLGLNRGDEESKKTYCVACFDDIKC